MERVKQHNPTCATQVWLLLSVRPTGGVGNSVRRNYTSVIYAAVNFALYGRLICGSLGVVWAWSTHATVSASQQQTLTGTGARV